jgi:hypothetical protein
VEALAVKIWASASEAHDSTAAQAQAKPMSKVLGARAADALEEEADGGKGFRVRIDIIPVSRRSP